MRVLGLSLELILFLLLILLLIRLALDWIQMFARRWTPRGLMLVLCEAVYTATDPPVKAMRRLIPSVSLGGMRLDLSFMVLLLLVYVLQSLNRAVLL